ncbi:MAG: hypothetical protein P9L92_13960 [Candidatus Electryonea clarkiae]|nr:hypothetical protein [Candidatus Electryonea clarkiae]MDP8285454.1 hypothetical protein [Candidatus Electryonea clarkiae]
MTSWGKAIGFGVLVWLTPFIVAFAIFGIHDSNRPLFESIMAVAVTGAAVVFGSLYMKRVPPDPRGEGLKVGLLWMLISILIDAPLMLFGGPMKMTFGAYMSDIGITYLCIPIVLVGLCLSKSRQAEEERKEETT